MGNELLNFFDTFQTLPVNTEESFELLFFHYFFLVFGPAVQHVVAVLKDFHKSLFIESCLTFLELFWQFRNKLRRLHLIFPDKA